MATTVKGERGVWMQKGGRKLWWSGG